MFRPEPIDPYGAVGPKARSHVSQDGYGGRFVIHSNPIAAVIDAIRGFCFPVASQQGEGGDYAADLSSVDEYAGYGGADPGFYGSGGGGFWNPDPSGSVGARCGTGTQWDPNLGQCIITPSDDDGGDDDDGGGPCSRTALQTATSALVRATQDRDRSGCQSVAQQAEICATQSRGLQRQRWSALRDRARAEARRLMMMSQGGMPKGGVPKPGKKKRRRSLPVYPDPTTTTEGNMELRDFAEPLGGHLDPAKIRDVWG